MTIYDGHIHLKIYHNVVVSEVILIEKSIENHRMNLYISETAYFSIFNYFLSIFSVF